MEEIRAKPEVVGLGARAATTALPAPLITDRSFGALRFLGFVLVLLAIGVISFVAGLRVTTADAAEAPKPLPSAMQPGKHVVYPGKTKLDFEGAQIEGELRNPGEFYFLSRESEKFDSLLKRRKNFHREMLRDVVLTK